LTKTKLLLRNWS